MSRHKKDINNSRGVRSQDHKRQVWVTYDNFVNMYDCVYERMVECGVAIKTNDDTMYTRDGKETTKDVFGLPTRYKLTKPEFVLMVDEVGCNTNQKEDGAIGGERFVIPTDGTATIP